MHTGIAQLNSHETRGIKSTTLFTFNLDWTKWRWMIKLKCALFNGLTSSRILISQTLDFLMKQLI